MGVRSTVDVAEGGVGGFEGMKKDGMEATVDYRDHAIRYIESPSFRLCFAGPEEESRGTYNDSNDQDHQRHLVRA